MARSKKKSNLEAIEDLLDEFDFETVRKAMISTRWGWAPHGVAPDVDEMRNTCRDLCKRLLENKDMDFCGTGGFEVRWMDDGLELRFYLREGWVEASQDMRIRGIITSGGKDE